MSPSPVIVLALTCDELRAIVRDEVRGALIDARAAIPATSPRLLDAQALAGALGVSRATIARLRQEGAPVACHVGQGARYELDAVRAWLAERGAKPTRAPPSRTEIIPGVQRLSRAGPR